MTLEDVEKSFANWRIERRNQKEKIPDDLWQQVATLYSAYPATLICRRLGLTKEQIKKNLHGDGFASFDAQPLPPVREEVSLCELSVERYGTRLLVKVPVSVFETVFSKLADYLRC